ncbi:hypothetical protein [Lysobacter sp. A3-1-A15]|uniref:hypothetical protein n=1 Tax=Novilysobacter viscosus TaxID=3098602 RepID=UPI002ED8DBB0
MRRNILVIGTAAVVAAATLATPLAAEAAGTRIRYVHATGVCQPATPLELGGLRFRPLGIFNSAIYVSCTLGTEFVGDYDATDVSIYFDNQGTTAQLVQCTVVGGRRGAGVNSMARSLNLPAGAEQYMLS